MFEREGLSLLNPPDQYPGLLNPTGQNIQGPGHRSPFQFLSLPGTSGNYASTPDSAAVSITGDIDIRLKAAVDDWSDADSAAFAKWNPATYIFQVPATAGGNLRLNWNSSSGELSSDSTVGTGFSAGSTHWVRATLDADNGAAGNTVRFYTSEDGQTWVQLGADVVKAGTTDIVDTASPVEIGSIFGGTQFLWPGKVYSAELRNGIDGTVVAKFDPANDARTGPDSFTSSTGEVWTVNKSGSPSAQLV